MSTTGIVSRGYVLLRAGRTPSAIVQRSRAEDMKRRFGGRIIDVKGQPYRTVGGIRVLAYPERINY